MKYFFSLLLVAIVLGSCKTSFRISVKEPAYVKLPDDVKGLGVVNGVTRENSPEEVIADVLTSQSLNGNVLASENADEGVLRALSRSDAMYGQLLQNTDLHNVDGSVNWTQLDTLCAQNNLQGIIEFTSIKTISPVGGSVLANATGQSSTQLQGYLYANLYLAGSHQAIEKLDVRRNYVIPLSGSSIIAILNDIQQKQQYYRSLGYELGYGLGSMLYPNWVWVNRQYYTKGSSALKRARPMIRNGNWNIAEEVLLQDVDNPKEKVRGRTLFNLALIKEGQGDIDAAIAYAERAALECGNKAANEYLVALRYRAAQLQQL